MINEEKPELVAIATESGKHAADVKPHALMAGVPAKQIGWVCECGQVLDDNFTCFDCGRIYFVNNNELISQ